MDINKYNALRNLYLNILQREMDGPGYHSYKDMDTNRVADSLLASQEYKELSLKKSSSKSSQVSIPYAIISINDRASENIKRMERLIPAKLINDIEYMDAKKNDMQLYFSKNNIEITWDEDIWERKPLDGELGVIASHLNCLKYIVDNNIPELIVFEDDAIIVDDFMEILGKCYNDLPKDYDFLTNKDNIGSLYLGNNDESILINSNFICKSYLADSVIKFMLYSYEGAKKIIDAYESFGIYEPIDWFIFELSRDKLLNGYSTFPGNTLIKEDNVYGSLIDADKIRVEKPVDPKNIPLPWRVDSVSKLYEDVLGEKADVNDLNDYLKSKYTMKQIKNIFLNHNNNRNGQKIPNIIHQTWKSKTELPENFSKWRSSFFELNPGFTINLYDDDDNRDLIIKHLPELLSLYNSFPREIYRADFVRALYLFFYGGIYADMDFQCLKPLDRYLSLSGAYLARMGTDKKFEHSIPNAMMVSSKDSAFWIFYILKMVQESQGEKIYRSPEYVTGPVVLMNSCLEFNSDIDLSRQLIEDFINKFNLSLDIEKMDFSPVNIMESDIWYPLNWNDQEHQKIRRKVLSNEMPTDREVVSKTFKNSEVITYWSHTWG